MFAQLRSVAVLLVAVGFVAGCSPATVTTPTSRPTTAPKTPTATPSASPSPSAVAIPPPPYAVVVTNTSRQGATYDILLINVQAQVVTRVTAKLPLLKPNQTITLPLVSASNDLVYYLDGDTDIRSLAPTGPTAVVKTIAAGTSSILGFAVSPDDQRIAVSLINQASDQSKDTGRGYVEDLADSANHVSLFNNTSTDSVRWPVGWHGTDIVDAAGTIGYGGYQNGSSYHVVSSANGARRATVCETSPTQSPNGGVTVSPAGDPVAAGTVCNRTEYYNGAAPNESDILSVDWTGHVTELVAADKSGNVPYNGCYLAPNGRQMACNDNNSQALVFVPRGGSPHNVGRRYNVLGWMDSTNLLVDIDSKSLAVVNSASGNAVNLALTDADKVEMDAAVPGAL